MWSGPSLNRMQSMETEQRTDQRLQAREQVQLPVRVDGQLLGQSQDISASGLYFLTDHTQRVGSEVVIEIALDTPSGPMKLDARGHILRIEPRGTQTGVAVRLMASQLVAV